VQYYRFNTIVYLTSYWTFLDEATTVGKG